MHLDHGVIPADYRAYVNRKAWLIALGLAGLALLVVLSVAVGAVAIPPGEVARVLLGLGEPGRWDVIIWNIRLPQAIAAVVAGIGLAIAGAAMQSILRNPLGSPFTLGISHAAAFGAALSVMLLGSGTMHSRAADAVTIANPYLTTAVAFAFCLIATGVIIAISKLRGAAPETLVLAGVALGALFTAGTMMLQYFADDVQLAAMVFWTFGDVGRASWREVATMGAVVALSGGYFFVRRWDYNAIDAGDETAKSLGVRVERVRLIGMVVAALLTACVISLLGIIGFVGLVCPHMVRRLIGDDHRFLLPGTAVIGALLLLGSDTAARLLLAPTVLPVSVLTAFLGAPVFLWLLIKGYRR